MLVYLDDSNIDFVFNVIYEHFTRAETVPSYRSERRGIEELLATCSSITSRRYPRFHDKATKLFIEVNKRHFFSNGNKRLALGSLMTFAFANNYEIIGITRVNLEKLFGSKFALFDERQQDYAYEQTVKDFSVEEKAYYILSFLIADSHIFF